MKELVKGTMDYTMLLAIFGSSALIAGLLLFLPKWFNRNRCFSECNPPLGQALGRL